MTRFSSTFLVLLVYSIRKILSIYKDRASFPTVFLLSLDTCACFSTVATVLFISFRQSIHLPYMLFSETFRIGAARLEENWFSCVGEGEAKLAISFLQWKSNPNTN